MGGGRRAARVDRAVWRAAGAVYRLEDGVRASADRGGAARRHRAAHAIWPDVCGSSDSDHSGELAASQGAHRTAARDTARSLDQEAAARRHHQRTRPPMRSCATGTWPITTPGSRGRGLGRGFPRRRPPTRLLDRVFQLEETRTLSNDWIVQYQNRLLQLARVSSRMPARSTVRVCEARNGQVTIRYRGRALAWQELIPGAPADSPAPRASGPRRTVEAARRSAAAGPDHPWRQQRYVDMRSGSRSVWQAIRD